MSAPRYHDRVEVPGRSTDVVVGQGTRDGLWLALAERFPAAWRIGLVIDERVAELWPLDVPAAGPEVVSIEAPGGEAAKTRAVLAHLQDRLLELRREEPIVAIGGGAVLDVAGFAAATVRRGLPWIAVPTTVVAMADAAVGGQVAVNHPRGKNLLGTFHPPVLVLGDVDYLGTLPERERVAGLAEVYKSARIADPELLEHLRRAPPTDAGAWADALARSSAVKARIVEADERDLGVRRLLNYGHTVGHALERLLGNDEIRHGEGVAMGMGVAARLARARGMIAGREVERQDDDLARLGLPTTLPRTLDEEGLFAALSLDKKRRPGDLHTFILPRGSGGGARAGTATSGALGAVVVEDVTEAEIRAALR
jgi:3-dehydroquinate synthetase